MIDLSIILPAHNESKRLPRCMSILENWLVQNTFEKCVEIIIVENGSSDETYQVATSYCNHYPAKVRTITLPMRGKGIAVKTGMLIANGAIRMMADVDLAMLPHASDSTDKLRNDWWRMYYLAHEFPVVIGSRRALGAIIDEPLHRKLTGLLFNRLVRFLLPDIRDSQCGFKCFNGLAAETLFSRQAINGMAFDVEILYLARLLGIEVFEVGVNWTHDNDSRVRMGRDSFAMVIDLFRIYCMYRNEPKSSIL
ncbi:MAG: glycosyltransferase [Candidatus Bathyarchaeota archaeon]|nr:glycosyltransferase [Candidatus Bathyarchaeota archaeon]